MNVLDLTKVTQGDGQIVTQPQIIVTTSANEGNDGAESVDEGIVLDGSMVQGVEGSPSGAGEKKGIRHGPNDNPGKNFKLSYEPPRGKTNNVVSEQVQHKLACTSTEKS